MRAPWAILQAMLQGILQGAGTVVYYLSTKDILLPDPRFWASSFLGVLFLVPGFSFLAFLFLSVFRAFVLPLPGRCTS